MVPPVIEWREAMVHQEIVLPYTEPETEWVRGRALQKVSPKRDAFLPARSVDDRARPVGRRGEEESARSGASASHRRARFAGRSFRMSRTFQTIACAG